MSLVSNFVDSYSISTWPGDAKISDINGANVITKSGDLESKISIRFSVVSNYSIKHSNLTIYFYPGEHTNNAPIRDLSIGICDDHDNYSWDYYTGYAGVCDKSYTYHVSNYTQERYFTQEGNISLRNYTNYELTFTPEKTEKLQKFILLINYTLPNFTFEQGDYYVAWLSLQKGDNVKNSIVLPSEDDIPRFIPNAQDINRLGYSENGKIFYRWAFVFEGGDDIIVWYLNDKEIKEKERKLQEEYTNKGVWQGFKLSLIAGILVSIMILFLDRLFFDWLPFGDNVCRWFIKKFKRDIVIGNLSNKTYHKPSCAFVDNIDKRNRKSFLNSKMAEKEGYSPCKLCYNN